MLIYKVKERVLINTNLPCPTAFLVMPVLQGWGSPAILEVFPGQKSVLTKSSSLSLKTNLYFISKVKQ